MSPASFTFSSSPKVSIASAMPFGAVQPRSSRTSIRSPARADSGMSSASMRRSAAAMASRASTLSSPMSARARPAAEHRFITLPGGIAFTLIGATKPLLSPPVTAIHAATTASWVTCM